MLRAYDSVTEETEGHIAIGREETRDAARAVAPAAPPTVAAAAAEPSEPQDPGEAITESGKDPLALTPRRNFFVAAAAKTVW